MIDVHGLTKKYGKSRVVDDVSFTVNPGTVTGFVGPNGAGKSTTMRMILGLDRPTAGTATINGKAYRELDHPLRTVGSLLDAKAVHPNRSARNHLRFIAHLAGVPASRAEEMLRLVGLEEVANQKVGGFSLGMGQRLGIAAAMIGDPQVLILDEPVNGLDPEGIRWVRELLSTLAQEGRTVFVSSHLLGEMSQMAQEIVVIGKGKILAQNSTRELIREYSQEYTVLRVARPEDTRKLIGALQAQAIEHSIVKDDDGQECVGIPQHSGAKLGLLAFEAGVPLAELRSRSATLEDAFMQTTQSAAAHHFAHGEER